MNRGKCPECGALFEAERSAIGISYMPRHTHYLTGGRCSGSGRWPESADNPEPEEKDDV